MARSTEKVRSASLAPSSADQGRCRITPTARALAPAVHLQVDEGAQLPGEELDMDARAAVHVRRVLPGQQAHTHPEPPSPWLVPQFMVTQMRRPGKTTGFVKQQSPQTPPPGTR